MAEEGRDGVPEETVGCRQKHRSGVVGVHDAPRPPPELRRLGHRSSCRYRGGQDRHVVHQWVRYIGSRKQKTGSDGRLRIYVRPPPEPWVRVGNALGGDPFFKWAAVLDRFDAGSMPSHDTPALSRFRGVRQRPQKHFLSRVSITLVGGTSPFGGWPQGPGGALSEKAPGGGTPPGRCRGPL